jgi:hypothetical protein
VGCPAGSDVVVGVKRKPEDSAARPSPLGMSSMPGIPVALDELVIGMLPWSIPEIPESVVEPLPQAAMSSPVAAVTAARPAR